MIPEVPSNPSYSVIQRAAAQRSICQCLVTPRKAHPVASCSGVSLVCCFIDHTAIFCFGCQANIPINEKELEDVIIFLTAPNRGKYTTVAKLMESQNEWLEMKKKESRETKGGKRRTLGRETPSVSFQTMECLHEMHLLGAIMHKTPKSFALQALVSPDVSFCYCLTWFLWAFFLNSSRCKDSAP